MTLVKAYAAFEVGGELKPFEYELGELGGDEVDIAVDWCGLCHSDVSMIDNEWNFSHYPLVPGHEIIGRIKQVGENVRHLKVGDNVGLGWQAGYCLTCEQCMSGNHNRCGESQPTIVGHHGGFADTVRAQDASVVPLPEGLDLKNAGPLLCGGVTVFNPLILNHTLSTSRIGIIGIGGLGHLAVKFCRAWGARVTAFTLPEGVQDALDLGADDTVITSDPESIKAAAGRFDLIISTVNVNLDWDAIIATLRPGGKLHVLGI